MRPFISSMATTTSPLPSSSSSSLCNNKVSTFSLTHSTTTSLIQAHFPPQHHLFKPFKLKIHISTFSPLFSLHSIPHFCTPSVGFNGSEAAQEEEEEEEEEDPEVELHDNQNIEEEEKEDERRGSGSGEQGRLYVGNLPYSMTSSQLSEVFGEAGRVVSVEVVYDRVTDRSRGFAFVTMESVEEAKEAIRMFNGSLVGGRTVKVNFPEVPRGGEREVMGPKIRTDYKRFIDSPHKIYAGNLSWGLTSQILTDAFAELPGLLSAKVIYDRSSGRCKGYGFISFETAEDAESALNSMNGVEVEGRPLRLNMASERAQLASPAELERTENSLDSSEVLSSISM